VKPERFFRIRKGVPFEFLKMRYVKMSSRIRKNYILALMKDVPDRNFSWKTGATFEFTPDEVIEFKIIP
jgi:hypothetical protein